MRNFLVLLGCGLLLGCYPQNFNGSHTPQELWPETEWKWTKVPTFPFQMLVNEDAEINVIPPDTPSYKSGMRAAFSSFDAETFLTKLFTDQQKNIFILYFFEQQEFFNLADFVQHFCASPADGNSQISRIYNNVEEDYKVFELNRSCSGIRMYILQTNNVLYLVEVGHDTYGFDLVWAVLTHMKFNEGDVGVTE
jgi:hypothetical protein